MSGGLWAAGFLDNILGGLGKILGVDTSGMSSTAALIAIGVAGYLWYTRNKPKPSPTPIPEPQPIPTPSPAPAPAPAPSPAPQPVDIASILQQLLPVMLPELGKLVDGLLKKRLSEVPQLGPETMVIEDADEGLEVFGATGPASARKAAQEVRQELSTQLTAIHAKISELADAAKIDDRAAINPATAVSIVQLIITAWPLIKVVFRLRGVKLPDAPLQQINFASLHVASEGGK